MSNSVRPHRRQSTSLPHSCDSPGKNTGVGCHFLFQYMKMKSESEVTQWCPTLSHTMDCSLPGSSIHGIFQARVLEWVAFSFSRVYSPPRDRTQASSISCINRWVLYHWVTWETSITKSQYITLATDICHFVQPTPVFLLGKFHGERSLEGYSPWHHKESDMTE